MHQLIFVFYFLLFFTAITQAQVPNAHSDTNEMHWGRFWARSILDRNLIWCPVWNTGLVSDSYIAPENYMRWPGSRGVEYLWEGVFYIAAQVTDMSSYRNKIISEDWEGDKIAVITSSYRANKNTSSNYTHSLTWAPVPGFFNGGPYGWIDGISEDSNNNGELDPGEDINFNGVLDYSLNPPESILNSMAISTDRRTWPKYWPGGSYHGDTRPYYDRPPRTATPGPRASKWNGEYGAYPRADQETLYRMDDHENDYYGDKEKDFFYWPMKNSDGTPDTRTWDEGGIAGVGIEVEGRTYAWYHPLAEDLMISIYRLRNYSDYDLPHVIVGMWADVHVGGDEGWLNNGVEYIIVRYGPDGQRTDFDILYQWQKVPSQIHTYQKIGTFGFAYLESPGIDYNDKDDDFDKMIDESMSDCIDNDRDWDSFLDYGLDGLSPSDPEYSGPDIDGTENNGSWDTEDQNSNNVLDPGEDSNFNGRIDFEILGDDLGSDGLGPGDQDWPGPDPNGTEANGQPDAGEPDFDQTDLDEADQAGLKYVYVYEEFEGAKNLSQQKEFYEQFFHDPNGEGIQDVNESDLDICFHFGSAPVRLKKGGVNDWQRFTIALVMGEDQDDAIRNKATMQEIYDRNYRFLTPPLQPTVTANVSNKQVLLYWDTRAESSKDPLFGHDFNGYRVYKSTNPKFLDIKTITDGFGNVILFKPVAIFDKKDGLTGIHPIDFPGLNVSYDMGNDTGLKYSFLDKLVDNGRTYYYAVTAIDAGNDLDFFDRKLVEEKSDIQAMPSESPFNITINMLGEVIYRERNTAVCIPVEAGAGFMEPLVDSLRIEHIGTARGGNYGITVYNKKLAKPGHLYEVTFNDDRWLNKYTPEYEWGSTIGARCINLMTGDTLFNFQYDNPYHFLTTAFSELDQLVSEGLHFGFRWPVSYKTVSEDQKGIRIIRYDDKGRVTPAWQHWLTPTKSNIIVKDITLESIPLPRDFELRVYDAFHADTSLASGPNNVGIYPLNFAVWDVTDPAHEKKMKIIVGYDKTKIPGNFFLQEMYGQIWDSTRVVIMFPDHAGQMRASWTIRFFKNEFDINDFVIPPAAGDIFRFRTERNPTHLDTLRFTVEGGEWSAARAKNDMRNIYVVPDPYVVGNSLESIYELAGENQRRLDFVNLPPRCQISIFTASGKLVRKLEHNAPEDFGRESWDLRTADGPEIAFGVYFFVVEAEGLGVSRGKFAVIK